MFCVYCANLCFYNLCDGRLAQSQEMGICSRVACRVTVGQSGDSDETAPDSRHLEPPARWNELTLISSLMSSSELHTSGTTRSTITGGAGTSILPPREQFHFYFPPYKSGRKEMAPEAISNHQTIAFSF